MASQTGEREISANSKPIFALFLTKCGWEILCSFGYFIFFWRHLEGKKKKLELPKETTEKIENPVFAKKTLSSSSFSGWDPFIRQWGRETASYTQLRKLHNSCALLFFLCSVFFLLSMLHSQPPYCKRVNAPNAVSLTEQAAETTPKKRKAALHWAILLMPVQKKIEGKWLF